jgi:AraC family transcriptional activator of pyochelin receptor
MNSINHLLSRMTFASREYGNIMCLPVAIQSPPAPLLFTGIDDVLALQASGPFGSFSFHELKNENYCVRHDQYDLIENLHLSANANIQSLGLHYALRNNIRSIARGFQEDLMPKNHYNMIYVPTIESEFSFEKEQEYTNFGIIFTPDYLERCGDAFPFLTPFLKRISRQMPSRIREKHPTVTPDIIFAIKSILQCDYSGTLKKMYLDSKVPELLLLSLKNIHGIKEVIIKLNSTDIQKLYQVREYLVDHIDNPGSIHQLAHEVGLNDFKLKNGFKQLFNNTVFGTILDERMQKARGLLTETDLSVHEISIHVGYKNLSNFTAAFKRRFGFPPTSLRH